MSFRSLVLRRFAVCVAALFLVSACSEDGRKAPLSGVTPIDIPTADLDNQANQNIANPTLQIPTTFQVSDGDLLTLVWNDEFDGATLDPEVWFFATGDGTEKGLPGGWGNNELQYYLPDNAQLVNGVLEITARREKADDLNYTSARILTEDRFAFKYGRIEASIKLPSGQGLWPAFWMLSQDSPYGAWAATGEIDIMEAINLDGTGGNEIFSTLHYGGEFPANTSTSITYTPSVDVTEDFHTYALEWDEFEMRWYFDGTLYAVQNSWFSSAAPYPAPFDQPFHILLNLAVGGNFPGSPNATTPFPATMSVDWVRVYSGEDTYVPADPGTVPDDVIYASDPNEMVDLVFGVDYAGFDPFGSGSTFNNNNTSDRDFSPSFGVTTGNGYGAQVGQLGIFGFNAGFATSYERLEFKAKNLNNDLIRVKFNPDGAYLDITLTNSPYATALGNGWYQVSVPIADFTGADTATTLLFETDNTAPTSFTFLLTDLGFSGTGGGGGGAGITPEAVVYATDPGVTEDLAPPAIDNFGSGAVFNGAFAGDADYNPAFQVTSGEGYGAGVHVGFVAFNGYAAGFASGYGTFEFKAKINDIAASQPFEVKFINGGDTSVLYDLTTYAGSTDLGNGWYQVQIPMTDFAANIAANSGFLMGPAGGQANPFTMLLTDIGFSGSTGGGGGGAGITPEAVVYATDPGVTEDLAPPAIDNFGSGAVFNGAFAGDADYNPAFQVTSGEGYGAGVHVGFVAFNGYAAGFASGYGTFEFKAKINDIAASQPFEVKFINGGDTSVLYDLTTYAGSTDLGNGWYQVQIPMTDFAANIAANSGFLMGPAGGQANPFTMLLTDIGFSGTAGGGGGGGTGNFLGIVPNGDFETGVLDDPPWKTFTNNGIVEVSSAQSTSGTFSVHLQASVPGGGGAASFPTLKVERLEEGNLTGGESVTVSFDAIAVTQLPGAVPFFAQLFTERSGVDTGASDELLIQPPQFLTDSWVTYTFNTTLGPDAGGGVSLLFKADCGASPGCELDAYVDNVSITFP